MRRALFPWSSAIALIVAAVLASTAALGVPVPPSRTPSSAITPSIGERSVSRADDQPSEQRGTLRSAIIRSTGSALSRPTAPGAGAGGSRGGAALGAASAHLELAVVRVPGERIDIRRDGVPSPARRTPPSRAPPLG